MDMRFILKPDGLYRRCIVCGREFKIESAARITEQTYKDGQRYVKSVIFGDRHPRNLMQVQCGACPIKGGQEIGQALTIEYRDPRADLRQNGLESWRDWGGT